MKNTYIHCTLLSWQFGILIMDLWYEKNGLNNNRQQNINIINNQINEIKACAVKIPLAIHEKSQKIVNAKMEDR